MHILWVLLVLGAFVCSIEHPELTAQSNHDAPIPYLERYFARSLYQRLCLESGGGNLLVSPMSINILLTLLLEGTNGFARSQLTHLLGVDQITDVLYDRLKSVYQDILTGKGNSVQMVTTLFLDKGFVVNKDFQSVANEYYQTEVLTVDVTNKEETARVINSYVMQHTNNTIRQFIMEGELSADSAMICVSTVHFRDSWILPFSKAMTSMQKFYSSTQAPVYVKMMHMENNFHFIWDRTFQTKVLILEFNTMGADNLFSPNSDLSGISCCGGLHISKIKQKAHIVLGEGGVEASSDSDSVVQLENGINKNPMAQEFRADHPFLFFLVMDEIVIFQGRVVQL